MSHFSFQEAFLFARRGFFFLVFYGFSFIYVIITSFLVSMAIFSVKREFNFLTSIVTAGYAGHMLCRYIKIAFFICYHFIVLSQITCCHVNILSGPMATTGCSITHNTWGQGVEEAIKICVILFWGSDPHTVISGNKCQKHLPPSQLRDWWVLLVLCDWT